VQGQTPQTQRIKIAGDWLTFVATVKREHHTHSDVLLPKATIMTNVPLTLRAATLATTIATGAAGQGPAPLDAPLSDVLPALNQQSSWAQNSRDQASHPDKRQRGVYPVGNGRVFAYAGLGQRANTLQAITGPHYQTDASVAPRGHFGEITLELLQAGKVVRLELQKIRRVRGANFVITEDATTDDLVLRTTTFAPPGQEHLVRVIDVHNGTGAAVSKLSVRVVADGVVVEHGRGLAESYP